jgi:hypothetical protein
MKMKLLALALAVTFSGLALADDNHGGCDIPQSVVSNVQSKLATVVTLNNGAIFGQILPGPNRMWSAVVDRQGVRCSVIKTGDSPIECEVWGEWRLLAASPARDPAVRITFCTHQ